MTDKTAQKNESRSGFDARGWRDRGERGSARDSRRTFLAGAGAVGGGVALASLPSLAAADRSATTFTVRVENVSDRCGAT